MFSKLRLVIILLVVAVVMGLGSSVQADSENSAIVINDFYCGMMDGNGGFPYTYDSRAVYSNDANGNSYLSCRSQVTPSSSAKGAVRWNYSNTGLSCYTLFGWTTNWQEIVTPSGQATLTCHINPGS